MDIMTNLAFVFLVLTQISIASITPPVIKSTNLTNHNLFAIKIHWDGQSQDDVDLYVRDPLGEIVYFKNKTTPGMTLQRDDTGTSSNTTILANGETVTSPWNEEETDIRNIIPGEYTVNVQMYNKAGGSSAYSSDSTKVDVSLFKTGENGSMLVKDRIVTLGDKGDEVTAFRFTLTETGEVTDINEIPTTFVKEAPQP
jgi:hypothetical protein